MDVINLLGRSFGRLVVIGRAANPPGEQARWHCKCSCGGDAIVRGQMLREGRTQSCGCIHREQVASRNTKHGHSSINKGITPTYYSWTGMIARCTSPNHRAYSRYGGRGIQVCERWLTFENFLADMGERPPDRTIDRIANNGNYEPGNCRWATNREQWNNKRCSRLITINGETMNLAEWARHLNIPVKRIRTRLERGDTPEQALRA